MLFEIITLGGWAGDAPKRSPAPGSGISVNGAHIRGWVGGSVEALLVTLKEAQIVLLKTLWLFFPDRI